MAGLILTAIYCSAAVGVIACLISESAIMAHWRQKLGWDVLYCPVCLGFWLALPAMVWGGPLFYFAVIGFSNVWMLIILKVYRELDEASSEEEQHEDSQAS